MSFQETLDANWDETEANKIVLIGKSEKTGEMVYIHFDGTLADASEAEIHYGLPNRCGTIESYVSTYNAVKARVEHLLDLIQNGYAWDVGAEGNMPPYVTIEFVYPNGKQGDINFFIATEFGEITEVNGLQHKAIIPTSEKEQIVRLMPYYDVRHDLMKNITNRSEISEFLNKYNLFHQLRQLADEFNMVGAPQYHPLRNKARAVAGEYMDEIRYQRHRVYAHLVANKSTTGKWKSEQKAYAIVKTLYPDALFQYKADWLGYQSLDIFIPSRQVGIEYQGVQHYKSVELFGGDEALRHRQELDENKRKKCMDNGVRLIDWRYDEPLTEEHIKEVLMSVL